MARVLFSAMSNLVHLDELGLDPFYEGMLKELSSCGNEVMFIKTNDILKNPDTNNNVLVFGLDKENIREQVAEFRPDVIITANNSIPEIILENTDCPVVLYVADAPPYFCSPDYIRKHVERYFFLHGYDKTLGEVCENLYGCKPEQNIYGGYATAVRAVEQEQNTNIVFVGFVGSPQYMMHQFMELQNQTEFEKAVLEFKEKTEVREKWDGWCLHVLTANNRIKTLDAIHDLGLKVHGWKQNFFLVIPYSMELARCYDFRPVVSLKDTQEVLNAAKIAPSLYNAQAPGGLSWRCADVMASNACLISPYKKDLDLISPYIKIPTFESPAECRELCQKLLKDDVWRKEVVAGCQKAINEKGRFSHLFAKIGGPVKLNLVPNQGESKNETSGATYICLNTEKCTSIYKKLIIKLARISVKILPKEIVKSAYLFLNKNFNFSIDQSTMMRLRKIWIRR